MRKRIIGIALLVLMSTAAILGHSAATTLQSDELSLFRSQPGPNAPFRSIYTKRFEHEPIVFIINQTMIA